MKITITDKEQTFIDAYFEAIDFTETGDTDQPETGSELDADYIREATIDCLCFYSRVVCYLPTDSEAQAGCDFWYTRNGHGAGFWDRPVFYGEGNSDLLTERADAFGHSDAVYECMV